MTDDNLRDRFRGCLLGGAVGDALGYGIEFDSWPEIKARYGNAGIRDYAVDAYCPAGSISDDTQMTLFTAEGLLRAYTRMCAKGISSITGVTENAYLRWLHTQGAEINDSLKDGWLITHRELFARRAPGNTCLQALHDLRDHKASHGETPLVRNNSKGCGSVMRLAPVALVAHAQNWPLAQTARITTELAEITHHHRTSSVASVVFVVLLQLILQGSDKRTAVEKMLGFAQSLDGSDEFMSAFAALPDALSDKRPTHEVIETLLGGGWIAEQALLIAVYAVLQSDCFDQILRIAVNHSGDSDSTGAIAGNIAGALYGLNVIDEQRWLRDLELRDVIDEIAMDLFEFDSWEIDEDLSINDPIWDKYPGW